MRQRKTISKLSDFLFLIPFYLTRRMGLDSLLQTLPFLLPSTNSNRHSCSWQISPLKFSQREGEVRRESLNLSPNADLSPCNFTMWHPQFVFYPRQCSSSCARGVQRRVVVCQDEDGQSATSCDAASRPPEAQHCHSGPCPQWSYGSWGEVSLNVF